MRRGLSFLSSVLAMCALTLSAPGIDLAFAAKEGKSAPELAPGEKIHEVARGVSLIRIAKRYGVKVKALRARNKLRKGGLRIQPGDELVIPAGGTEEEAPKKEPPPPKGSKPAEGEVVHEVASGESLSRIARKYGVKVRAIRERNGLSKGGKRIQPGDELIIPKPTKRPKKKKKEKQKEKTKKKKAKPIRRGNIKCPSDMVSIHGNYCIDRYEAYVALMLKKGKLRRLSPFKPVPKGKKLKALNKRGRMPQAYISRDQAARACKNAGKRLCTDEEWLRACKGKKPTTWPYGNEQKPKRCNDSGFSAFQKFFGPDDGGPAPDSAYTWENLNDPRLNREKRTLAPSGRHKGCKGSFKVYDMVGNLHEWTSAPGGTFRGGYYLDVKQHGHGCNYKTTAHNTKYHDYSTGFRCCKG